MNPEVHHDDVSIAQIRQRPLQQHGIGIFVRRQFVAEESGIRPVDLGDEPKASLAELERVRRSVSAWRARQYRSSLRPVKDCSNRVSTSRNSSQKAFSLSPSRRPLTT